MTTAQFTILAFVAIIFTVINLFGLAFHFGPNSQITPFRPSTTPKPSPQKGPSPNPKPGQDDSQPSPESPLRRAA